MEQSIELPTIAPNAEKAPEDKTVESAVPNDASTAITNEMEQAKETKTVEVPKSDASPDSSSQSMNSFGVYSFSHG